MRALLDSTSYFGRQLLHIAVISFLIFLLVRAVPGDIADYYAARGDFDEQALAVLRENLGLNDSLPVQFQSWLTHAFQGDLGESMRFGTPVADMLFHGLPHTLALAGASLALGLAVGLAIAVLALAFPKSRLAALVEGLNVWSISVPTFCTGVIAILIF